MSNLAWAEFFSEFATALLRCEHDRVNLIEKSKRLINIEFLTEKNNKLVDIDPFTIFALFHRGVVRKTANKKKSDLLSQIKKLFGILAEVPTNFDGIPAHPKGKRELCYYFLKEGRSNDIDNLWTLFRCAVLYADKQGNQSDFIRAFNDVITQTDATWDITMGLSWIRPSTFIHLDANNIKLLMSNQSTSDIIKSICTISAENYMFLMRAVNEIRRENLEFSKLPLYALRTSAEDSAEFYEEDASYLLSSEEDAGLSEELDSENASLSDEKGGNTMTDVAKNTILYGPPGTGKTYSAVEYAVAIVEDELLANIQKQKYSDVLTRYNTYKADGLIEFTTFHQSYGYEEFIEGIKPVVDNTDANRVDIQYSIEDGLFKDFCNRSTVSITEETREDLGLNTAPNIWLWSAGDGVHTEGLENGDIRIKLDNRGEDSDKVLQVFKYIMKVGDIVFSYHSDTTIDALGVVTGDYWKTKPFGDGFEVKWIVKDINEDIVKINGGSALTRSTVCKLEVSFVDALALIRKHLPTTVKMKNCVFIIDEINRGNISKIFGELITLIEPSKRMGQSEGIQVKLPYSQKLFGVPDNVYIIGTMNTADRSIATIDTALRRRFRFQEMMPDAEVLKDVRVGDVSVSELLTRMNQRISVLYDREHTIGHTYFVPLKENSTIEQLAKIFENDIIPLLQSYFYDDYEKIRLVLGDNQKENREEQFIRVVKNDYTKLFGSAEIDLDACVTYEINREVFHKIEAYRSI